MLSYVRFFVSFILACGKAAEKRQETRCFLVIFKGYCNTLCQDIIFVQKHFCTLETTTTSKLWPQKGSTDFNWPQIDFVSSNLDKKLSFGIVCTTWMEVTVFVWGSSGILDVWWMEDNYCNVQLGEVNTTTAAAALKLHQAWNFTDFTTRPRVLLWSLKMTKARQESSRRIILFFRKVTPNSRQIPTFVI